MDPILHLHIDAPNNAVPDDPAFADYWSAAVETLLRSGYYGKVLAANVQGRQLTLTLSLAWSTPFEFDAPELEYWRHRLTQWVYRYPARELVGQVTVSCESLDELKEGAV